MTKRFGLSDCSNRSAKAEIRNMSVECERYGAINLAQGVCDLALPQPVLDGTRRAMEVAINADTCHDGLEVLRKAIARKIADYKGITADPETEVVVSAGSTGALSARATRCPGTRGRGDRF